MIKKRLLLLILLLGGCRFLLANSPPVAPELLTAVSQQLTPNATLLLPTAASSDTLRTIDLTQLDETTLRDLLRQELSLYLLYDPNELGLYDETAVANITWLQNHSEPVQLNQYNDGTILYWIVVPPNSSFGTTPLRVAPGG